MEAAIKAVSFTLIVVLFLSPVLIVWRLTRLNTKCKVILYVTFGTLTTVVIALTLGWWVNISNQMLLEHYGYIFDAMNDTERFGGVSHENMERVKSIETSMKGVGWPLKALMTCVLYSPYLLVVYFVAFLFRGKSQGR